MATNFSETLMRLRKEAGFPTAYRFYYDNGGAAAFKVSYRNYLMMEQGRNLPVLARLEKILLGLRMPFRTPMARELTQAWLRTMAGEEHYANLLEPLFASGAPAGAVTPADDALRRALAEKKYHMTAEQLVATVSSFETYKCAFTLENDSGTWTAEALAKVLGIRKAAAALALKNFHKAGLVTAEGKAGYRSKMAGKLVEYPAAAAIRPEVIGKLRGYLGRLESESPVQFANTGLVRADADAMRAYYPMVKANVEASHAFSSSKKTKSSAGFMVVSRVHKLWDF